MITPTIPPAMLEAATRIAFEIRGFSVRQLERAPSIYHRTWEECNRQAIAILEVAGIAKLQAAADALPGLVAALEWAMYWFQEDGLFSDGTPRHLCEYNTNPEAGYCKFHDEYWKAQQALAAVKGGAQ